MYICNPFTGTSKKSVKKFYTYAVIQGISNGLINFKIQIISPRGNMVKETESNGVMVEENIIRARTQWLNINFNECGEYTIRVLIKCNNMFDTVGYSHIFIV